MLILAIDDEINALKDLSDAIREIEPDAELITFRNSTDVLELLSDKKLKPDVVFSDIRIPGMDGLELALKIKIFSPDTKIIFVTGYQDYALKAFKVHASGYLMKPVRSEEVAEELKNLNLRCILKRDRLYVRCFGTFDVFWNEKSLSFKRRKTKELFAYLIDCNGASCTSEEVIAVLWEDENNIVNAKHNLRNLVYDLKAVLKEIGQEKVIIRNSGFLAIDREELDCDYYQMLKGDVSALNMYTGEYMNQYHWAQITEAKLFFK